MSEIIENKLFERDEETGAFMQVMTTKIDETMEVIGNKLYKRDEETGAFIAVVSLLENSNALMVPDYENIETINRISSNNGTWEADRTGYVRCSTVATGSGQTGWQVFVNNNLVRGHYNTAGVQEDNIDIIEIAKGDVIRINGVGTNITSIACLFIPPKFIQKTLPVVVEKNGSYSLEEIKTAETWIDGRPIYKKTIMPNTSLFSGNGNYTIDTIPDIDDLVKYEGMAHDSNNTWFIPYNSSSTVSCYILKRNTNVVFVVAGTTWIGSIMYITIFYTKTTD